MRFLFIIFSLLLIATMHNVSVSATEASDMPFAQLIIKLSQQEEQAISSTISVAATDYPPFVYWDKATDTYKGITITVLQMLTRKTGAKFKLVIYDSYESALKAVRRGDVDIMFNVNQSHQIQKSDHYFTNQVSLIVDRFNIKTWTDYFANTTSAEMPTAVVIAGTGFDTLLELYRSKHKVKIAHTPLEAISLVSFTDANYAVMDSAQFGYYQRKMDSHHLLPGKDSQLIEVESRFGFKPNINPLIYSVIEKALLSISQEETEYLKKIWSSFEYRDPAMRIEFIIFLISIAIICVINIIWSYFFKIRLKSQERLLNTKWLKAVNETLASERHRIRTQLTKELEKKYALKTDNPQKTEL